MNKVVSRALWGAFFVGGLTVLGAGAAHAADTSGENGVASGSQVGLLGELPVTIGGNAISILGDSESSGTSTTTTDASSSAGSSATSGEAGIAGGSQVIPDIVAPIVASGNAISILGDSSTEGTSASTAPTSGTEDGTSPGTTGADAVAGGTQVMPDVDAPIIIGGNSISLLGDTTTEGTATGVTPAEGSADGTPAGTTGEDGIAGGNQVIPDVEVPIIIGGNSISLLGDTTTEGTQTSAAPQSDADSPTGTTGEDGIVGGNQLVPDVNLPIIIGGNSISVVGDSTTDDTTTGVTPTDPGVETDSPSPAGPGTDVTGDGTPLMATAALTPTVMLAATGTEALPLIGGTLLMLIAGLGMVVVKRLARVNG